MNTLTLSEQLEQIFDDYSTNSILIAISNVLESRVKTNHSLGPQTKTLLVDVYTTIDMGLRKINAPAPSIK
jgi:hypothetical protein